ncbi:winged helix-turn-helix transcriptional regulator [Pseudomonas sp. GM49]|uniref:winged helix-turn-helix transcriptional regulator n=1 Tax=Pseudomonas sp. GM49 TaxID=1144331 RepID=UPI0009DAB8DB
MSVYFGPKLCENALNTSKKESYPEVPPRAEYALMVLGHALGPAMTALIDWAELRHQHEAKGIKLSSVSDNELLER